MISGAEVLRNYWYPVCRSEAVADKPYKVKLLDTNIVIWRAGGEAKAFRDLCIHRGTQLSLGWIDQGQLVCPYHGWCFGSDGKVMRIPAMPPDRPIPSKARVEAFFCQEKYGLVFVCLGTPKVPLPEVPEFSSDRFITHLVGPTAWKADAARSLENFMDDAHLPWVHSGKLGNRDKIPIIASREVKERATGFYFDVVSEVSSRTGGNEVTQNKLTYDIELPFTLYHENIYPGEQRVIDLFFVTPVSDAESIRFMVVARNFALDQPTEKFVQFTLSVWEEDRPVIESQRPELLPIDWNAELHVRGPDSPSIVYRRKLAELGFRPNG